MNNAEEKVIEAIVSEIGEFYRDEVKPDASLKNDLGLDSLDCTSIAMTLDIDDYEMAGMKTVQDLINYVSQNNKDYGKL